MSTATIPFSNPGGKNQTPSTGGGGNNFSRSGAPKITASPLSNIPGSPTATGNPYTTVPTTSPSGVPTINSGVAAPQGTTETYGGDTFANNTLYSGNGDKGGYIATLVNNYGSGAGGELAQILNSMSGEQSQVLQQFIASLQPSFAQNQAGLSAKLGAMGVGANSSVNAIAQSNLMAQENAAIAGEGAQIQMQNQQDTIGIVENTLGAAQNEHAQTPWTVLGNVLGTGATLAGDFVGAALGTGGGISPNVNGSSVPSTPSELSF